MPRLESVETIARKVSLKLCGLERHWCQYDVTAKATIQVLIDIRQKELDELGESELSAHVMTWLKQILDSSHE